MGEDSAFRWGSVLVTSTLLKSCSEVATRKGRGVAQVVVVLDVNSAAPCRAGHGNPADETVRLPNESREKMQAPMLIKACGACSNLAEGGFVCEVLA